MSNVLDFGVSAKNPSKIGGVNVNVGGSTIKYFPRPVGSSSSATGGISGNSAAPWSLLYASSPNSPTPQSPNTNIQVGGFAPGGALSVPNTNNPTGALWIPVNSFDGQPFDVYAAGTFGEGTNDPSSTVNIQLRAVTGTFANPVYTTIASTGVSTANYATVQPWLLQATLLGDSVTGFLTGTQIFMKEGVFFGVGGGFTSPRALDTIITGLDFQNGNPALQQGAVFGLVIGITFGTNDPGNKATMTCFTVES